MTVCGRRSAEPPAAPGTPAPGTGRGRRAGAGGGTLGGFTCPAPGWAALPGGPGKPGGAPKPPGPFANGEMPIATVLPSPGFAFGGGATAGGTPAPGAPGVRPPIGVRNIGAFAAFGPPARGTAAPADAPTGGNAMGAVGLSTPPMGDPGLPGPGLGMGGGILEIGDGTPAVAMSNVGDAVAIVDSASSSSLGNPSSA